MKHLLLTTCIVLTLIATACAPVPKRTEENLDATLQSAGLEADVRALILQEFEERQEVNPPQEFDWSYVATLVGVAAAGALGLPTYNKLKGRK